MITKTITLSTTDWLHISFMDTRDANWFVFWANAWIEFTDRAMPNADEVIPLSQDSMYWFDAPQDIRVRGPIWTEIYLWPFDSVPWSGGWGWSGSCTFSWVYHQPSWFVAWTTCQEWIDLHFPSTPPTVDIRWTDYAFWLYEVWQILTTPLIEWRWHLWANPVWLLTNLDIAPIWFTQTNPTANTRYWNNDANLTIILWTTQTYTATIQDDQSRSWTASWSYTWTFPYYGTSVDITTLTKQILSDIWSTYFQVDMVAETGWDKYKADFETSNITITWVMFYNTVSSNWEWMWWSKANSLTLRTTSAVTHTVQGNITNYTRYTHNWVDGWALLTRFYTN